MRRVYPIFTDGKKFYHGSGKCPDKVRFAYFSKYDIDEWREKDLGEHDKSELKKLAKRIFER